jgi:hypothetical protein
MTVASCKDPTKINVASTNQPDPAGAELEDCPASANWLPTTPQLMLFKPNAHPVTECAFYRGGWQNFLIALQPDANGQPALLSYPTIDEVFDSSLPPVAKRSYLGDIKQAGGRQVLIDQNGNAVYYGIQVSQSYVDFIAQNDLRTIDKVVNVGTDKPRLFFPAGIVEFKDAWQVYDKNNPPADIDTFVTADTTIPTLSVDPSTGLLVEDRSKPIPASVRLLAIHVVYTYPGHPAFIWASFEHTGVPDGQSDTAATDNWRDLAPIRQDDKIPDLLNDPSERKDSTVINADGVHGAPAHAFVLYHAGVTAQDANSPPQEAVLAKHFNAATQNFGADQATSIFRLFPASKSNDPQPDGAITSLNSNVQHIFAAAKASLAPTDRRGHYRLVGAQWMDKPEFFGLGETLENDATSPLFQDPTSDIYKAADAMVGQSAERQAAFDAAKAAGQDPLGVAKTDVGANGSDSVFSILAGEDRMSSAAMESFTQDTGAFPNCFSCHNTQDVVAKGVPYAHDTSQKIILKKSLLNVSHIFSQFVLDECPDSAPAVSMSCPQCQDTPRPKQCTLP